MASKKNGAKSVKLTLTTFEDSLLTLPDAEIKRYNAVETAIRENTPRTKGEARWLRAASAMLALGNLHAAEANIKFFQKERAFTLKQAERGAEVKAICSELSNHMLDNASTEDRLVYLASRWADEHEYEDIEEYRTELQAILPNGAKITSMIKRPFGCKGTYKGCEFTMKLSLATGYLDVRGRMLV